VPDDPCPADEDLSTSDGCPKTVWITRTEVRIADRVEFQTGKAVLRPESLGILDRVVAVLLANPQLQRIEVQGHTDNVGSDEYNSVLSQDRASAVVAYLAQGGVERVRLVPRGYGEAVPMFTNMTPEGRFGNRRVQFVILDKAEEVRAVTP
jgi:outer membrane protein OmpA-like peptidoglycan-associated protein